jgi:hypothetical protein
MYYTSLPRSVPLEFIAVKQCLHLNILGCVYRSVLDGGSRSNRTQLLACICHIGTHAVQPSYGVVFSSNTFQAHGGPSNLSACTQLVMGCSEFSGRMFVFPGREACLCNRLMLLSVCIVMIKYFDEVMQSLFVSVTL